MVSLDGLQFHQSGFHYGKGCTLQDKNAQGDKTCQTPAAPAPSCVGQPEKLPPCPQKIWIILHVSHDRERDHLAQWRILESALDPCQLLQFILAPWVDPLLRHPNGSSPCPLTALKVVWVTFEEKNNEPWTIWHPGPAFSLSRNAGWQSHDPLQLK